MDLLTNKSLCHFIIVKPRIAVNSDPETDATELNSLSSTFEDMSLYVPYDNPAT